MAQTIKLKRSSTAGKVPSTSNLALGEIAINTFDGRVFIKKNDGSDKIEHIVVTNSVSTGSVNFTGAVTASEGILVHDDIMPNADNTLSLGSSTVRFQLNGGTPVTVDGNGTANTLTRFQSATTVEDSNILSSDTATTITHSNNGNTIFTISGSNGELLTVTDSNTGNLLEVNDTSGIDVFVVSADGDVSASGAITASGIMIVDNISVTGNISGSSFNGTGLLSGSIESQLPTGVISGSIQVNANTITNFDSNVKDKLNADGVISGSGQVSYTGITNKPTIPTVNNSTITINTNGDSLTGGGNFNLNDSGATTLNLEVVGGVISGSGQLSYYTDSDNTDHLNSLGVISGSSQLTFYTDSDNTDHLNSLGVISGSSQITITESQISDLDHYTDTDVKTKLNAETVISGSSQVSYTDITNKPTIPAAANDGQITISAGQGLIVTSAESNFTVNQSANKTISLAVGEGVISGSIQVNANSITNFDSNVKDKLNADGVISGSSQLTFYTDSDNTDHLNSLGVISGSSQITITESQISDLDHYTDTDVKTKLNAETVISGSSQVSYTDITNKPTIPTVNNGTITINTNGDSLTGGGNFNLNDSTATTLNLEIVGGVISGSSQITITESQISDLTHYTDADVKDKLNADGVISGSSQLTFYTDSDNTDHLNSLAVVSGSATNVRSFLNVENNADVTDTANVKSALNANLGTATFGDSTDTITIPGNLTVQGTQTINNVNLISTSNGVVFEGTTDDANETTLIAANPTADRTITLPNAGGTVALTSDIPTVNNATITLSPGAGIGTLGNFTTNQSANETISIGVDGVLQDLDTLGAPASDGQFIVATGAGTFAYESGATVRTSLGLGNVPNSDHTAQGYATGDNFDADGTFASLRAQGTTKADVGLGNVTNESKATMFASPTFTTAVTMPGSVTFGTLTEDTSETTTLMVNSSNQLRYRNLGSNAFNSTAFATGDNFDADGTFASLRAQGTTAGDVGLGNVTNESKSTMFTNAALTGTPTAPTADVSDDTTQIATTAFVKSQNYLTSADGGNATTLDSIDSSGFIRANADDDVSAHTEWQDGKEIRLGSGNDAQLYHNGTNMFLANGTGNLIIRNNTNDGNVVLQSDDGSGGIDTYLYLDGANVNVQVDKRTRFNDTSNSTTKTTGGVVFSGGVGIAKTLNVGEDVVAFASSDERYKDNVTPIENPNEKLKQIGGYTFDWNDKHEVFKGQHDVGVIAQEIEKVLPEIVETRESGYKAVKYEKIVALLIESNKELLKRVEDLESKLK